MKHRGREQAVSLPAEAGIQQCSLDVRKLHKMEGGMLGVLDPEGCEHECLARVRLKKGQTLYSAPAMVKNLARHGRPACRLLQRLP